MLLSTSVKYQLSIVPQKRCYAINESEKKWDEKDDMKTKKKVKQSIEMLSAFQNKWAVQLFICF